jgi:phosphate transport system permease protein
MDISTKTTDASPPAPQPATAGQKSKPRGATRAGDRIFLGLSRGSGILLLVVMAAIAVFLTTAPPSRSARTTGTS